MFDNRISMRSHSMVEDHLVIGKTHLPLMEQVKDTEQMKEDTFL